MKYPLLSIVVSTFNRADHFLPQCLDSIIKQSFVDYELIIVDDHSTDYTNALAKNFIKNNPKKKIQFVHRANNSGSDTKPKNTGASVAMGKYLMFVDDDVALRPEALQKLTDVLQADEKLDVAYGDMWIKPNDEAGVAHDFDTQLLLLKNYIDTSAAIMRRSAFIYVQGFDERLPKFIDWNLWVRMAKAGFKFKRLPEFTFDYYIHENTKSNRVPTEMYMHPKLGELFTPTFDPGGCYIQWKQQDNPKVAIFTIHYDRLRYSQATWKEMYESAGYPFTWWAVDNGSTDGTAEWLKEVARFHNIIFDRNRGISEASNAAVTRLYRYNYDLIIKIDNDVEFTTQNWLADIADLWKRNHALYISPYVEGLRDNPGGALRVGLGFIGRELVEVTQHIGGIFAAIDARAYKNFRWSDAMLHGNQDTEASQAFRKLGYMPMYFPKHRIVHRDGTEKQQDVYPEYFKRRVTEKRTVAT